TRGPSRVGASLIGLRAMLSLLGWAARPAMPDRWAWWCPAVACYHFRVTAIKSKTTVHKSRNDGDRWRSRFISTRCRRSATRCWWRLATTTRRSAAGSRTIVRPLSFTSAAGDAIAYRRIDGTAEPGVLWLGGMRSSMDGAKATALEAWARARGRACLRF